MGGLIAIAIIWYLCTKATSKQERSKQRKGLAITAGASLLWFLDGIFNAGKNQNY